MNDFLEQYGERIEELSAKRSLHEAGNRELAELTAEYKAQENRPEQLLRDIDPAWTRQELLSLPVSASEREEVRRIGAAFAGYDRRMEALFIEQRGPSARRLQPNRRCGKQGGSCARSRSGARRPLR